MSDLFTIDQLPDRTITHDGNSYLFFSGTAYLGLQQNPVFRQLLIDSIDRYGTSFGSSRNGNLRIGIYELAESELAAMAGAPHALTLSSGMLAGQVVINWLRAQNTAFIYGPQAHPALWDGPVVDLPTLPFAEWSAQLPDDLRKRIGTGPIAILTNSVDAARSVYYSFDWVADLPDDRPITLVVDDSHGLGVLNNTRGIWPQIPQKPNVNLIVTGSLAKAMGLPGGVLLGKAETLAGLRQTAFFGACSPVPPAYMNAFTKAGMLYAEGRERLRQNLILAEKLLIPTGLFSHATGYPIFFSEQDDLYTFLLERGIMIYSFSYPTPADRPNTRIIISAFHTFDDIQALAEAVYDYVFGLK